VEAVDGRTAVKILKRFQPELIMSGRRPRHVMVLSIMSTLGEVGATLMTG